MCLQAAEARSKKQAVMPSGPRKLGGDLSLLKGLTPAQVWWQFFPTCVALPIFISSSCTHDVLYRRDCCLRRPTKLALHTPCAPTRAAISNGLLHICSTSCLFVILCIQHVGSWSIARNFVRIASWLLLRPVFSSLYISWPSFPPLYGFVRYNICREH